MTDYKGWDALMMLPTNELELLKKVIDVELDKRNAEDPISLYKKLDMLVGQAYVKDNWDEIWDEFWEISNKLNDIRYIDYCDPDTSYKEDILARFNSYKEYYEEYIK